MKDHEIAIWDGDVLQMTAHYDWPEPHDTTHTVTKCRLESMYGHYWVAADGQCFGLIDTSKTTCIATVETMLHAAGHHATYVTFATKNKTPSTVKRWIDKWSKRTTGTVDRFDASVRVSA